MKNIFKFMGVALLACSLVMVSCKKDDENGSDSTTPGTDPQPQPQPSTVVITWGGQTVNNLPVKEGKIADISSQYTVGGQTLPSNSLVVFQHVAATGISGEDYVAPIFYTGAIKVSGLANTQAQIPDGFYLPEQIGIEANGVLDENEESWSVYSLNSEATFGTFDATRNTFSFSVNLKMFNYDEMYTALMNIFAENGITSQEDLDAVPDETYEQWIEQAYAEASKKDYTANLQNVVFTPVN